MNQTRGLFPKLFPFLPSCSRCCSRFKSGTGTTSPWNFQKINQKMGFVPVVPVCIKQVRLINGNADFKPDSSQHDLKHAIFPPYRFPLRKNGNNGNNGNLAQWRGER